MNNEKENQVTKSKKIGLIIILFILVVIFMIYGLQLNISTDKSIEESILLALNEKYHQDFEIIELITSRQYKNARS